MGAKRSLAGLVRSVAGLAPRSAAPVVAGAERTLKLETLGNTVLYLIALGNKFFPGFVVQIDH